MKILKKSKSQNIIPKCGGKRKEKIKDPLVTHIKIRRPKKKK